MVQASMPGERAAADIIRERYSRDGDGTIGVHEIALLQSDVTLSTVATRYMMYMGTIARRARYFRVLAGGKVPPWIMTGSFMFSSDASILAFKRLIFNITASVVMPTCDAPCGECWCAKGDCKDGREGQLIWPSRCSIMRYHCDPSYGTNPLDILQMPYSRRL